MHRQRVCGGDHMASARIAVGKGETVAHLQLVAGLGLALQPMPLRVPARALPAPLRDDDALARAWRELEPSAHLPTQSQAFTATLSRTLLAGEHIQIFRVADPALPGRIAALAPLCRQAGLLARWRMAGACEVFEPGDALYDSAESARRLAALITADPRPLSLDRVPASSLLVPALRDAMRGRGLVLVRPAVPCPTIALDPGWTDPESRFNAGRRSDFRRAARRAQALGAVTCEVLSPTVHDFDSLFDEAVRVELCGWKQDAGTAMAVDHAKQRFFREYFRAACAAGTFRIAFMRIDGVAVAMQMALEWQGRFWLFKIGYDETFGKCSPGTLLMLHTLGWAARQGLRAYELLGNVEPWIAAFWTREQHDCLRVRTYPFNVRGAAALAIDGAVWLRQRLGGKS